MKKHLILTSLVAIFATTGVAKATDITPVPTEILGGYYQLGNGSWAMNSKDLEDPGYTYLPAGSTTAVTSESVETAPDVNNFKYEDLGGTSSNYNPDDIKAMDYFAGTTVAGGDGYALVASTQAVAAQDVADADLAGATKSNYSYESIDASTGVAGTITYTGTKQTFTRTHTLNETYVGGDVDARTITITDGDVTSGTVSADMYKGQVSGDDTVYHLVATTVNDATTGEPVTTYSLATADGAGVDIVEAGALQTLLDNLSGAYVTDTTAINTLKTDTGNWAETELTAFGQADAAYTADNTSIKDLTGLWLGYKDVKGAYETAAGVQTAAAAAYQADLGRQAYSKENTPTETPDIAADIISGDKTTLDAANAYADSLASNYDAVGAASAAETTAKSYTDALANGAVKDNADAIALLNGAEDEVGSVAYAVKGEETRAMGAEKELDGKITAEAKARVAEDKAIRGEMATGDALTLQSAKAYAAEQSALTLSQANAYTDKKVDTLEKNVSGGVAAATALSAVNVSSVGKGEVSVGAGYGYYNSQSAAAFGAAMGLSDRWSINAGAGIAQGDKTQYTFRAGTNYKFKLF
ncbi:MAG: YadA-like family protein [Alphaproteobacteria bacterium]|nr:YadA-like family protein [Alphaproteobacteria bacterium]